jgi:hypothetical protein
MANSGSCQILDGQTLAGKKTKKRGKLKKAWIENTGQDYDR